ncbi:PspA/IM30 family protein [Methylomonas methanica]|uniref:PspA/IM30 family protein n=1 Tax=Methylomonas methanica (strain DSM 25384 / MC09) TaxID=857087 RepID=F9ZW06_METMM|nr:PspA/IM30 family protein [Methylomonas methanica]AEG00810.1 PspA/IM30 family protein [Methylomonas methanica MC09]
MTETLAARVTRLIVGGAHTLIEKAENLSPEAVMAQSVREIDQIIAEVRLDFGKSEAAKHLTQSQMAKLNAEHEQLNGQIEVAVAQGRDDLATAAIGRQTDIEDYLPVLQKSLDEQSERAAEFENYLLALQAKKRELTQLLDEYTAAPTAVGAVDNPDRQTRVDDAQSAFDRALVRQGNIDDSGPGIYQDAAKLKELAELQRNQRIAERLAAIKTGATGTKQ